MKKFLFGAMILLSPQITFSQTVVKPGMDLVKHTVASGETVLDISKKYVVDPAEIYRSNRSAIDGVKEGMVLEFYVPQKSPEIVLPSDNYKPIKELDKQKEVEKPKEVIVKKEVVNSNLTNDSKSGFVMHKVTAGETLYGLSRLYNISVDEIKSANVMLLKNSLQVGQTLKIPKSGTVIEKQTKEVVSTNKPAEIATTVASSETVIKHSVAPKETLYGIAKKYNVSVEAIMNQNEKLLKNGLQAGQVLTIISK
ncbi:LysM peptidoglycan-binding domain-containing protein [Flavobacterium filum]|uniref:LysM peptidoglycan-binding domain-containing protein n=1 Tax=Flavobacterium TaxID=237 RepID=UPI00040B71F0|nr:LysM peptidoglycan-binding domain-containing protein [Flavobacterium filum]